MNKLALLSAFLLGMVISGFSQNSAVNTVNLVFDSEAERQIWQKDTIDPFNFFRAMDATKELTDFKWNSLIKEIDEKASKNSDQLFLVRTIFQKSHQRLLKKYRQHSSFNAMLGEGTYDCVSGSAVLGMLLERYGIDFEILETDYHVFIHVNISGKPIILESTLPVGGMITSPSEVEKYLSSYLPIRKNSTNDHIQRLGGQALSKEENSIFRKVNLLELAGLQYYNDAIFHFNSQAFSVAINQLSKAYVLYPTDRIDGLRELSIELAYKTYGYHVQK